MSDYLQQHYSEIKFDSSDNWILLNPIEISIKNKIEQYGTPLSEWDIQINYGIKTGYNDAFIIDESTKNALIASDPKSGELIRPILRGKDIKKYSYDFANLWIIYIPCGFTNINKTGRAEEWFSNNYNAIYTYLVKTEEELSKNRSSKSKGLYKRDDQGDYWWELRSCKYMDDFNKQKIIYPETTQGAYFIVDNNKYVADKTCFILTGNNLYYLVAILSSTLYEYSYKKIFSSVELGTSGYQYNKHALVKLPVILPKRIDKIYVDEIEKLASDILNNNFNESTYKKIDRLVFDLYSISDDEIEYLRQNSSN